MLNLFDVLVKPILIYGSDVWGIKSKLWDSSDKVFLQYARCLLHVKATTSNVITTGECGSLPPSMNCQIAALCYLNRLHHMDDNKLAKQVYCGLVELNHQGFNTWATDALRLANDLGLDISMEKNVFSTNCKQAIKHNFTSVWLENLQNTQLNPLLRAYRTFKHEFAMEPYCPACRTSLIATRFWVVMICPIIKCLTVLESSFILFDLCLFITIFNFILNYVPIVTFWILTYHKIWILLIIFCFIWSYWIIYFLTCLEVFWSVVS